MLAEERQQAILEILADAHVVKLQKLVQMLDASESTIRRDLQELENRHLLRRVHGGASLLRKLNEEPDMETKKQKNKLQKKRIAQLAASKINDNDCIYLDAGTTTLEMIPFIHAKSVTVVTNSPAHGNRLIQNSHLSCYLLGGLIKPATKAIVGSIAMQTIRQFRFDAAFIGANGIETSIGYTTPDPEEAALKRCAHDFAACSYIVADSSKFNDISFCKIFDLQEATLITDAVPEKYQSLLSEMADVCIAGDSEDTLG